MKKFSQSIDQRLTARHTKSFLFCGDIAEKDILDIGSSFGWFEKMSLKKKCRTVTGIEPNKEDFYLAKKEVPGAKFQVGSALKIPFPDNSFDLVVMFDVIEHIPKNTEIKAVKEIKRVLRPGGKFVMSTDFSCVISNIFDPAWYFGHRHYKEKKLIKIMENGGLKVKKVERCGGVFEIVSTIMLYFFKWVFRSEMPLKAFFEKKREIEYLTDYKGFTTIFVSAIKQ